MVRTVSQLRLELRVNSSKSFKMYAKLLGVLLFACRIILNESSVVDRENEQPVSSGTLLPTQKPNLPEGYVSFPDDHAAYKIHRNPVIWTRARELCIAEGAQLAVADTAEKIQHIYSTLTRGHDWISVGIQFSEANNKWNRIDTGLPLTTLPWKENNPDDDGNCVAISFSGDDLVNCSCDELLNWYACEIPI